MSALFLSFGSPRPCCWCFSTLSGIAVSSSFPTRFHIRDLCPGCYGKMRARTLGIYKLPSFDSLFLCLHYTNRHSVILKIPRRVVKGIIRRIDEHPAYCRREKADEADRSLRSSNLDERLGDLRRSKELRMRLERRAEGFR